MTRIGGPLQSVAKLPLESFHFQACRTVTRSDRRISWSGEKSQPLVPRNTFDLRGKLLSLPSCLTCEIEGEIELGRHSPRQDRCTCRRRCCHFGNALRCLLLGLVAACCQQGRFALGRRTKRVSFLLGVEMARCVDLDIGTK